MTSVGKIYKIERKCHELHALYRKKRFLSLIKVKYIIGPFDMLFTKKNMFLGQSLKNILVSKFAAILMQSNKRK